jgi:diacylglycerol kinase (ATP)
VKTRFIYNPRSGHNAKSPHLLERARLFIAEHQLDAEIVHTERPRHATELARRAVDEGCELIVAIGGDGTMNEVAAALIDSPAALGLIPCGSGNGLGRHLGIPGPGKGAFRNLLNGDIRTIDTGLANGIPFFNAMGVGFDAEISHRFNRLSHRGLPAYVHTTFGTLFRFRSQKYIIRCGDMSITTSAFIISVANSDQYGNDCFIAPGASVDDGRLNITVLKSIHFFNALPIAVRLFTKSIDGSASVQRLLGPRFSIERPAPGLLHTDGETHETAALIDVTVRPRSLRVMVPRREAAAA